MLKNLLLSLVCVLTLSACNTVASDGFHFEKRHFTNSTVKVHVKEYRTLRKLKEAAIKSGLNPGEDKRIEAFSILDTEALECTIHFITPEVIYKPESIGHELAHCLYGNFHDSKSL